MTAYITNGLEVVGNVTSKSEAFKLAWEAAKVFFKAQTKMRTSNYKSNFTVRDWFNVIIGKFLKRFYNPICENLQNRVKSEQEKQSEYYSKLTNTGFCGGHFTMD